MTQTIRWLAVLALLLASGAGAVRAEEEEEVLPPTPKTVELLPAPRPAEARCGGVCVPTLAWPIQFVSPSPCPCPIPFLPAAFAPGNESCGSCAACPCAAACAACPCPHCPACAAGTCAEPAEYVVEMKMVKAGVDGDEATEQVTACPRVSVSVGQPATVQLRGVQSATEQSSLMMQAAVTPAADGVMLDLQVTDSCSHTTAASGLRAHAETTETRCPVALGKATKMELTHDANGACRSWVEVRVTAVEREERAPKSASACTCPRQMEAEEEEDVQECGPACVTEVVECGLEMATDTAYGLFGLFGAPHWDDASMPAGHYLERPPQYCPPEPPAPMARELSCHPLAPSCQAGCSCASCTQCAASEPVKADGVQVHIDASHDRKCVEVSGGPNHFKATADRIVVEDSCIHLEGDVQAESSNDSHHEATIIQADKMTLERKDGGLKIHIDD